MRQGPTALVAAAVVARPHPGSSAADRTTWSATAAGGSSPHQAGGDADSRMNTGIAGELSPRPCDDPSCESVKPDLNQDLSTFQKSPSTRHAICPHWPEKIGTTTPPDEVTRAGIPLVDTTPRRLGIRYITEWALRKSSSDRRSETAEPPIVVISCWCNSDGGALAKRVRQPLVATQNAACHQLLEPVSTISQPWLRHADISATVLDGGCQLTTRFRRSVHSTRP